MTLAINLLTLSILFLGIVVGYLIRHIIMRYRRDSIEAKIRALVENAKTESRDILINARDRAAKIIEDANKEERARKGQLIRAEDRLAKREEVLEKKNSTIERKEKELDAEIFKNKKMKTEVGELRDKLFQELERISGLSREDAKNELFAIAERNYKEDLQASLQKLEKERYEEIERKSRDIMLSSIQRYARSHISDILTSSVNLPDADLKGKIIGREGRNIRALERATGVEVIVDETPDAITLSSFDPIRRQIAKLALENLIKDGRIQPARIEEKVEEARKLINERVKEAGEAAVYEVGILDLPREIVFLLGRLAFRTSYAQNVLDHSIEAAHLAGMIAYELGLNVEISKKSALLHDIGKAVDHEIEGDHIEIGRKILQKYKIDERVIKAMESHHETYPFSTPESYVVAAAEAVSAARPGARRDTLENYLKRIEELEKIALSFDGIEKAYAISGGKEVRVFVVADKIDDFTAMKLAREIADRIEQELKYPGEIKVNVIREIRAVEYAR